MHAILPPLALSCSIAKDGDDCAAKKLPRPPPPPPAPHHRRPPCLYHWCGGGAMPPPPPAAPADCYWRGAECKFSCGQTDIRSACPRDPDAPHGGAHCQWCVDLGRHACARSFLEDPWRAPEQPTDKILRRCAWDEGASRCTMLEEPHVCEPYPPAAPHLDGLVARAREDVAVVRRRHAPHLVGVPGEREHRLALRRTSGSEKKFLTVV